MGRIAWLFLAISLLGLATENAQMVHGDVVVFFQEFVLPAGETLEGNLVLFAGQAVVEAGASVQGNVYMFGGSLLLHGEVQGNMVVMGGKAVLGSRAVVQGTLTAMGGQVVQEPGARVGQFRRPPGYRPFTTLPSVWVRLGDLAWRVLTGVLRGLALGLVALVATVFFPTPLRRMARALERQTALALAVGASSLLLGVFLAMVLAFTVVGVPLALLLTLGVQVLRYLAVLVLGHEAALGLARRVPFPWPEPAWNALGTTAVAWGLDLLTALGCSGWLLAWMLVSLGVGAVWLSRFGTLEADVLE